VTAESVTLSRRVAQLMNTEVIRALSVRQRSRLAHEVMEARRFEDLRPETRALILAAEQEAAAG